MFSKIFWFNDFSLNKCPSPIWIYIVNGFQYGIACLVMIARI